MTTKFHFLKEIDGGLSGAGDEAEGRAKRAFRRADTLRQETILRLLVLREQRQLANLAAGQPRQ